MPEIININSKKGLVRFSHEELVDFDLIKWIRTDSKGVGNRCFASINPFETSAAKVYKEKYPSQQVKLAEKVLLTDKGTDFGVEVVLRVADEVAQDLYNTHPTKLTLKKEEKSSL